jgi:hypothetical protein
MGGECEMKQFGALLKSKGIGVPFVVVGVDHAEPASDVSALSVLSASLGPITSGSIKSNSIKADQITLPEGALQGLKGAGEWGLIAPAKPAPPQPHDIPIDLAFDALVAHGLMLKDFTWNHGYDQHPYVNLELVITSKEASTGLYDWISKKGYF